MKILKDCYFVLGAIFISFILGSIGSDIGEMPKCSNEPYGYDILIIATVILLIPFILGIFAGKDK